MGTKPRKPATPPEPSSPPTEVELPERWSVQRKSELVLRLLRGEALDAVSRESQVPAHELESWKRIFLEQGTRGLKTRSDPEVRELTLARAKIGELMMRLELAEHLIEKREQKPFRMIERSYTLHLRPGVLETIRYEVERRWPSEQVDRRHPETS
jgi:hypothetical protein